MTGCKVTLAHLPRIGRGDGNGRGLDEQTCGLQVVKYGLCAKHYADRIRLGGAE